MNLGFLISGSIKGADFKKYNPSAFLALNPHCFPAYGFPRYFPRTVGIIIRYLKDRSSYSPLLLGLEAISF